jgi:hypothetical protein
MCRLFIAKFATNKRCKFVNTMDAMFTFGVVVAIIDVTYRAGSRLSLLQEQWKDLLKRTNENGRRI